MPTRRSFLKLTGATTLAWYVATQTGWTQRAMAAIPGGTLDLTKVPKYVTPLLIPPGMARASRAAHLDIPKWRTYAPPLLIPPVMPRTATITMPGGKPGDYYEISVQQFKQQILPTPLPMTTVWGYGPITPDRRTGLRIYHAPSLTIESTWKRPVRVKWINELVDANKNFLPHLLPVDPTLHWANPPQGSDPAYGTGPRDSRPTFTETPGTYTGPVPIVTHLHGAAGVG